jgi:hypothetical protein
MVRTAEPLEALVTALREIASARPVDTAKTGVDVDWYLFTVYLQELARSALAAGVGEPE